MNLERYTELLHQEFIDQISIENVGDWDGDWFILQMLSNPTPELPEGRWESRAICHVNMVAPQRIFLEGYELVNLINHFATDEPIPMGQEVVSRINKAFSRGSLNQELTFGQLGIDLNNLVVQNKIAVDWKEICKGDYVWNSPTWRAIRLKDIEVNFSDSINYQTVLQ